MNYNSDNNEIKQSIDKGNRVIHGYRKRLKRRRALLAPRNLTSQAFSFKLDLSWTPGFIPGKVYKVYKDGGFFKQTQNTYVSVDGLDEGTACTVTIVAADVSGFESSPVYITDTTEVLEIGTRPRR